MPTVSPPPLPSRVRLAPGAEENGLACMLAELVRQNLEAKPRKNRDFDALTGSVAIVADDAEVALTLRFERGGSLTIHDGIVGVPDMTIRGPAETIMALSNLPIGPLGLPIPNPRGGSDPSSLEAARSVFAAVRGGRLHMYGMAFHVGLALKLTRVMSIHG
ncbi:MAG: hypothetical protein M3O50_21160 [Myxococcota bacterium]|nr:hypothetical protein [Myxococcota bacterium]